MIVAALEIIYFYQSFLSFFYVNSKKLMTSHTGMEENKNTNTTTKKKIKKQLVNKTLLFTIGKKCNMIGHMSITIYKKLNKK